MGREGDGKPRINFMRPNTQIYKSIRKTLNFFGNTITIIIRTNTSIIFNLNYQTKKIYNKIEVLTIYF